MAGKAQFGQAMVQVEPAEKGAGFCFRSEVEAGAVPRELVAAAERSTESRNSVEPIARALRRLRAGGTLHRLLAAWEAEWRRLWPPIDDEGRSLLDGVVEHVRSHLLRFPALAVDDAAGARQALGARLATAVRRSASQPAALFAYLALFAVDLERLRGEFVLRARPVGSTA